MKIKIIAIVSLLSLSIFTACSGTSRHQVDAETFMDYGGHTVIMGSASQYTLEKVDGENAVIRHWTVVTYTGKPKNTYYYIPLSELPKDIADQIKDGKNPWTGKNIGEYP